MPLGPSAPRLREPARQGLSQERIIEAALAVADADGIDAVTMRRVGTDLGVAAMALYRYFATKDELLQAAAERILTELTLPPTPVNDRGWQATIRQVVHAWAALAQHHPGAFRLIYLPRRVTEIDLLPGELILSALTSAGFDAPSAALAYRTVLTFIDGVLLNDPLATVNDSSRPGHLAHQLLTNRPVFAHHLEAMSAITAADVFDHGLELLLTGLEHQRPTPRRPAHHPTVKNEHTKT
ncbi:TetR/AcrR family transcriptional regulator [Lapillicoccus sp.]|uniref:TetR/AcrR family transcriptional regulator n=1 Tax=Lapillicoccus sp. TaxID=1909287 RepID=UPI0025DCA1AC|nr:TetR/AcrR family transcriptional regulator [Lapillicoccus sp.]